MIPRTVRERGTKKREQQSTQDRERLLLVLEVMKTDAPLQSDPIIIIAITIDPIVIPERIVIQNTVLPNTSIIHITHHKEGTDQCHLIDRDKWFGLSY